MLKSLKLYFMNSVSQLMIIVMMKLAIKILRRSKWYNHRQLNSQPLTIEEFGNPLSESIIESARYHHNILDCIIVVWQIGMHTFWSI